MAVGPARAPRQESESASDEVMEMAPGLLRLQLPIPLPGLRHVNCYALEDERGWTVVDPGMPGPWFWKTFERRCRTAGFRPRHIHTVVVTHSHPDHFGGAGRLRHLTGADVVTASNFRVWWSPDDPEDPADPLEAVDGADADVDGDTEVPPDDRDRQPSGRTTPWGTARLLPPRHIRVAFQALGPLGKRLFPSPRPSIRLDDADEIRLGRRDWIALHTPGHTIDHLCLFDPDGGILLAGDHVLPTITPHISGLDAGPDPLGAFVASLDKVAALPQVRQVLPAHGHPFDHLATRVEDIKRHHEDRLKRLRGYLAEAGQGTVTELSHRLFRPRSWGSMAESETYAHLEHLRLAGEVTCRGYQYSLNG